MRPDKKKVVDEVWDDERIRGFLDKKSLGSESNTDFSALLYAYRSMRVDDFQRFLGMFVEQGRDLNASSREGLSLLASILGHRQSPPFQAALRAAGAAG
jgi:hypothetical protein